MANGSRSSIAEKDDVRTLASQLPLHFLEKLRLHWTQINAAFSNLDMRRSGKLVRSDFEAMSKRTGLRLTSAEIDLIMQTCDRNKDGLVDFREFAAVVGDVMQPPSKPEGTSLNFGSAFDIKRPEGRRVLRVECQAMDEEDKKKPLIQVWGQTILEGKYYTEKRISANMHPGGIVIPGLLLDVEYQQPMSKSLLEGLYYFAKNPAVNTGRAKVDFIQHNCRMTREYSRLLASSRPSSPAISGNPFTSLSRPTSTMSFDHLNQPLQSAKGRLFSNSNLRAQSRGRPTRPSSAPPEGRQKSMGIDKAAIEAAIAFVKSRPSSRAENRNMSRDEVITAHSARPATRSQDVANSADHMDVVLSERSSRHHQDRKGSTDGF